MSKLSSEWTCVKFLDAVACKLFLKYDFELSICNKPTMSDLLKAKSGKEGVTWEYRKNLGQQLTTIPLPDFFTQSEWEGLESLHADTMRRIYDGRMPTTLGRQRPFVIIPNEIDSESNTEEYVASLKRIAVAARLVPEENDLVVFTDESV